MRPRIIPPGPSRQRGAIAVAFIVLSVLLLGFVALGTDAGRLYVSKTELQNAADACALAAAAALTGANTDQLTVAENYGITAGTRNLVGTQETGATISPDDSVTFSATLGGTYRNRSAVPAAEVLDMRYARCTLYETNIPPLFIHVVNLLPGEDIGPGQAAATAVASLEPAVSNCALPLAVCKQADTPPYGMTVGQWIHGRLEAGGGIEGAFKWIQYPGYERTPDLAGLIAGNGQCDLNDTNTVSSHPGQIDSLLRAWNTRLGIYRPGSFTSAEAPPDWSGWVYDHTTWPAGANAFDDFAQIRRPANDFGNVSVPSPHDWASLSDFQAGQDRRLVVGPIVDCDALGSNGTTSIVDWACYLILHPNYAPGEDMYLEYRGLARQISSGCVTSGLPGGPSAGGPKVPALVQ